MGVYNLQYINEFFGGKPKLTGPIKYTVMFYGSDKHYKQGETCYPHKDDIGNSPREAIINELKRSFKAEISGNKVVVKSKYNYLPGYETDIVQIRDPHPSPRKLSDPNQLEAKFDKVVDSGTYSELCKKYDLTIDTSGKANKAELDETKLRKAELKKVISYAKSAVKSIRDKYGNDMDFNIVISVSKDDAEEFYEQESNSVIISTGGLYDSDSKTEDRRHVEEENVGKRNKIFNEAIKAINTELKIDKSIRGKVTDDWDHYDFIISYDL